MPKDKTIAEDLFLGVNFDPQVLKIGLVNRNGKIFEKMKFEISVNNQEETISIIESSIQNYINIQNSKSPVAIGIAVPGVVNSKKGVWMHSMISHIAEPYPLAERISKSLGIPVFIDNDIHVATFAENYYGIGRITENFILIYVGVGVSMGIVSDGMLVKGANNSSGEIGHMSVEHNGDPCICGHRGCLEKIVGEAALVHQVIEQLPLYPESSLASIPIGTLSSDILFNEAQNGDLLAKKISERAIRALGTAVVSLTNIINPEHILFIGRVVSNKWFFDKVHDYVYEFGYISTLNALLGYSDSSLHTDSLAISGSASLCWNR